MADLVIKELKMSETPDENGVYVKIVGRAGGIVSWIFSLIGIDPTTTFSLLKDSIVFEQGSLGGSFKRIISLDKVSSTFYGYRKPWKEALVIGIIFGVIIPFIGAIVGILYYILKKTLSVGIIELSGVISRIDFQRSVIEGNKIEEQQAKHIAEIIQNRIMSKTK